ncbi:MAG: 50S ribosomal protein L9 [bacterium]
MKVIFLQTLEHNKVGDIKEVPDGYARNYLLKKGVAVVANEDNIKNLQSKIDKIKKEEDETISKLIILQGKIESLKLTISAQAGEEDKLFGAVTNRDITDALKEKKIDIDKHDIEIQFPIHELGEHEVLAKLGHGIHATVKVKVVRAV